MIYADQPRHQYASAWLVSGIDQCYRRAGIRDISLVGSRLVSTAFLRYGGEESSPSHLGRDGVSLHADTGAPALDPAAGRARTRAAMLCDVHCKLFL